MMLALFGSLCCFPTVMPGKTNATVEVALILLKLTSSTSGGHRETVWPCSVFNV